MTRPTFAAAVALAAMMNACGGSSDSTQLQHPTLDAEYADRFAGTWAGSATVVVAGQTQTVTGNQQINRTGFNRISIVGVCLGSDGAAGLDSATTFSMDALACAPVNQSCGPVTIRYDSGLGNLAQDTLTIVFKGTGSGCGQSLGVTLTFTGKLATSATGGAGPIQRAPAGLW